MSTVDVEDETILTAIFKDSFPESWKENPDFVQYLAELSSFGIEKLSREPERLAEEKAQILEETQDLAFHNYKTFIETAECSREIFEDFQIIEKHVSNLLQQLPPFSSECENIAKRAQEINASRRMNSLTLQRHTQLLEILEMPQLMDTCVRNGYYEEALELTAHVKRLEKKHYNLPVIASIVDEVKGSTQLMLNQLIQQLRTNIQLPLCLRVIGYLRRMDVFSEAELRIKFLQARDAWFQCIIDGIPTDDAYVHITKIIEASRVHLFDIITQYRAIFSDDDTLMTSSAAAAPRDDLLQHSSPFYSWLTLKVNQFLSTLESDLSKGVGGRLDSLVGQCMYFSLSFSRIGADFRSLLVPIFYSAALNSFQTTLNNANKKFSEMMQSYNLMGLTFTGGLAYNMSTQPGQLYPPSVLLDFQPLANYCNHVLTAFNDLRLCLPISLACDITDKLEKSLLKVNDVILSFHRAEESTLSNTETDHFQHLLQVYTNHFLPYVQKCMLTLFPPSHLAQTLGLTIVDLTSMGNPGSLNIELIQAGVSHLLPEKEDDVMETAAMEMNLPPLEDTNVEASQQNAREVENAVTKRELSPEMSSATAPGETLNTSAASTSEDALVISPASVTETTPVIPASVPEATTETSASVPKITPVTPTFVPGATPVMSASVPEATPVMPASVPGATPVTPATPKTPAFVPEATPDIPAFIPEATPHIPAFVPEATPKTLAFVPETSPFTASHFPEATTDVSPTSISNIAFPMDPTRVNLSSLPLSQVVPQDNDPNMNFTTESLDRIDLDDIKLDEASATN